MRAKHALGCDWSPEAARFVGWLLLYAPARQGTGLRRGSLHPPRRQGAFRPLQPRLHAQPAHRPTLKAPCGTRVDCLRSRLPPRSASLRVVAALRIGGHGGKRSSRHRPGTSKPHMPETPDTPASLRVKVRPELPGNFPLRGNLSHKSRSFPLDPLRRGGAARASRAKAPKARRKSGAFARAAFARAKNEVQAEGLPIRLV